MRAHIFIGGRVQGVFFRQTTRVEARKRAVKGWIRNLPDGRVEAIFEGKKEKIEEMIDFCKRGPPTAKVTRVKAIWEEYSGIYSDFSNR